MYEEEQDAVLVEEEADIVEFSDEEGNTLQLEVLDYFFYNGDEYAVLGGLDEDGCDECDDDACDADECDHDHEHNLYIMKVVTSTAESGEEMEEFIPVDEELMSQLIEVVQTRFSEMDDDEDEEEEDQE